MARLRYVKNLAAAQNAGGGVGSASAKTIVRTFRAIYETEPEIAAAVLPQPLKLGAEPLVFMQFAHVIMELSETHKIDIGAVSALMLAGAGRGCGSLASSMTMEAVLGRISAANAIGSDFSARCWP